MSNFDVLKELIEIDSPSGFTHNAIDFLDEQFNKYGFKTRRSRKGALICRLGDEPARLALAAHVDTLGAIVSGFKNDGTLAFSPIGGPSLNAFEGEYLRIHTMEGAVVTGTLLLNNPSTHANRETEKTQRSVDTMHIRVDEDVKSPEDCRKLGIRIGDIISFDTRYQETASGYIKSRFMDNKAGCYVLLEVARRMAEAGRTAPVDLFISNYEEVGHGGACPWDDSVEELLVIDMGVVGDACEGGETFCSICAKDSSGPYDYAMRTRLVELAEAGNIKHKLDVYPFYGSDGSAALRAGNDFRVALIGPGVAASHGVERAHKDGIEATVDLSLAYIDDFVGR